MLLLEWALKQEYEAVINRLEAGVYKREECNLLFTYLVRRKIYWLIYRYESLFYTNDSKHFVATVSPDNLLAVRYWSEFDDDEKEIARAFLLNE